MQKIDYESIYRKVIDAISRNDETLLDQFLDEQLIDHNPIPGQTQGTVTAMHHDVSRRDK